MNLLDKVRVISDSKDLCRTGSEGYIAWIKPFNPNDLFSTRMDVVFTRFGKAGKPRIEVYQVNANPFDLNSELIPEMTKLNITKEDQELFLESSKPKPTRYSSHIILERIENNKLRNLLELSNFNFLAILVALSWPLYNIYNSGSRRPIDRLTLDLLSNNFRDSNLSQGEIQYIMDQVFLRDAARIPTLVTSGCQFDYKFHKKLGIRINTILAAINDNPGYRKAILSEIRKATAYCAGSVKKGYDDRMICTYEARRLLTHTIQKYLGVLKRGESKKEKFNVNKRAAIGDEILNYSEELKMNTTTLSGSTDGWAKYAYAQERPPILRREDQQPVVTPQVNVLAPRHPDETVYNIVEELPNISGALNAINELPGITYNTFNVRIQFLTDHQGRTVGTIYTTIDNRIRIVYIILGLEFEYSGAMLRLYEPPDQGPIIYNCLIDSVPPFEELYNIINALSLNRRYSPAEIKPEFSHDATGNIIHLYRTTDMQITIKFRLPEHQQVEPVLRPAPQPEPVRMRGVYMVLALPTINDIVRQINLISRSNYLAFDVIHESTFTFRNESQGWTTNEFRTNDHIVTVIYNVLDNPNQNTYIGVGNVPNRSANIGDAQ